MIDKAMNLLPPLPLIYLFNFYWQVVLFLQSNTLDQEKDYMSDQTNVGN